MGTDALSFVQKLKLRRAQKSAWKEVRWFYGTMDGRVPKKGDALEWQYVAARKIRRWLQKLPTFHAGAFKLRYTPRTWPPAIAKRFGSLAAVVVRIECAQHPSDGTRSEEALEKASVERLEMMIADRRRVSMLYDLDYRAYWHLRAAHKAYVQARGTKRCALPRAVEKNLPGEE
jgi:hypothetical protein